MNNAISQWLVCGCYAAGDLNDEEATELAAKLNRLVKVARALVGHPSLGCICDEWPKLKRELAAALAEIELPESP